MKTITITGLWKISPGQKAEGWEDCLKNGIIGIGWAHERDLHGLTKEEIVEYARENFEPKERPVYIANQLIDFIFHIKKGNIIVAYSTPSTIYGVGVVEEDDWEYNEDEDGDIYWLRNTRKVKWVKSFSEKKIEDHATIYILGQNTTILPIKKDFFNSKILSLYPNESIIDLYEMQGKIIPPNYSGVEEDEQSIPGEFFEEKKKLRFHKSVERNQKLSNETKAIHGYTCMACGFNFKEKYGDIGKNYIEAHHLVPFSQLEGNTKLSPKKDFAVLCANCHRMIHKFEDTSNIKQFKKIIR